MTCGKGKPLLFLLALTLVSLPQFAVAQTPYVGSESGSFTLSLTSATTAHANATATGSDNFGSFTSVITADLDLSNPSLNIVSNGTFDRTYVDGTIFGTFTGTLSPTSATTATFTLPFLVTGGTGHFAGITGSGLEEGNATFTGPLRADFTSSFRATVVPEPGTLALLAGSLFTGSLMSLRRRRHR
ncbi:MAG TPA: PEP-CTERM sorting domain-containing protein [Chthonomonadaceae bacterium]|nr:PEP-CTERM sorting domain-containing protein [Chthonomonadaceae bacterium]